MPRPIRLRGTVRQRRAALLVVLGLAAFVGAVFVVVVLGGGLLVGRTDTPHPVLSVAAAVVVALAFDRVQRRLHRWASRLTHGGEQSPYEVLTALSTTVTGSYPAEDAPARIAEVLARGTGARWAGVWLTVGGTVTPAACWPPEARPAASSGTAPDDAREPPRPPSGPGIRSCDVRHAGELLGVLVLQEREGRPLTAVEERLLADLAAQAGSVLHGARLRAERTRRLHELALRADELEQSRRRLVEVRESERRRLERDLHDGAQQLLVALAVNLRLAQALAPRSPDRAAEVLTAQAGAARQTVETVLGLARGVYPRVLTESGLAAALEAAARSSPIPVDVEARDVGRYPADVEAAVYFACLEALQNAAKHSGGHRVRVRLSDGRGDLRVTVDDDGRGLPAGATADGAGLANMRDRIDAVGGRVALGPAPGGGVRVALQAPVTARAGG